MARRCTLKPSKATILYDALVAVLFVSLLVVTPAVISAMPYMLLMTKSPKCFQVHAHGSNILHVHYDAPGTMREMTQWISMPCFAICYSTVLHFTSNPAC